MLSRWCLAALPLTFLATESTAQTVELTSSDQTIRIVGELIDFDGETYAINTTLGTLRVKAALLTCAGEACPEIKPPTSEFAVAGSRSMTDLLVPALMRAYGRSYEADVTATQTSDGLGRITVTDNEGDDMARVDLIASNSSNGLADLLQGDASIALSTRPARRREVTAFASAGLGDVQGTDQEHVVALDGLLIVTSPDNPVRAISEVNAALIFSGSIRNWSEIGGPDAPINVYARDPQSGTTEVFNNIVLRPQGLSISGDATVLATDQAVSAAVAEDPLGIGFTSFVNRGDAKALAIEGVCGLQTPPSEFTIKTEEYPLTRRLFMYTAGRGTPFHVADFIEFTQSQIAQAAVSEAGFVDQRVSSAGVDEQGLRFASAIVANRNAQSVPVLQRMVRDMLSSDRLSTTFRFQTGSSLLDNRAQTDLARLAEILNEPANRGKIVQLIGFTDSVGDDFLNQQLSARRAEQVRDALFAFDRDIQDRVTVETLGYGEISPLGCNETAAGRFINRRVEVWLREDVSRVRN